MLINMDLLQSIAIAIAGILGAVLLFLLWGWWRRAFWMSRARRIAARLRTPATSLAMVEEQSAAVEELTHLPPREAAVATRELLGQRDAAVRSVAIEILRRIRALDSWVYDLHNGGYRAKLRAIEALGQVGDERAIYELIEALGDDDPDVAQAASRAVVAWDVDYACDRLADALASPNRMIAETAAAVLVRLGEDASEAVISQLASLSAQARRLAAECLGAIGSPNLANVLLPLLDHDPDPSVRVAATEAITRIGGTVIYQDLQRLAHSDPDWFVRARAYTLLAEVNAPGAGEFLLDALGEIQRELAGPTGNREVESVLEGPQRVRSAIIASLRLLGYTDEQINQARREAIGFGMETDEFIGDTQLSETPFQLYKILRDPDHALRAEAAQRLAEIGSPAVPALQEALLDPDPLVRVEAARSLGQVGTSDSLKALSVCLSDPDPNVRLVASTAVRAIVTRLAAKELSE